MLRGTYVAPPAGAIGRGDAFLLRIGERVDATVLSNDSFQEFHVEHPWLFERGRLIGASHVPGIGWIFVPRAPVRGPRSRISQRNGPREKERVVKAIAVATKEAVTPDPLGKGGTPVGSSSATKARSAGQQAVNDPITFIGFIVEYRPGDVVEGEVEAFASHGAVVRCGEVRCYAPLSGLGSPPPKSAREVFRRGERREFIITALDPHRRGVEVGLPNVAVVSGHPSDETVQAEVRLARRDVPRPRGPHGEAKKDEKASPRKLGEKRLDDKSVAPLPDRAGGARNKSVARTATEKARLERSNRPPSDGPKEKASMKATPTVVQARTTTRAVVPAVGPKVSRRRRPRPLQQNRVGELHKDVVPREVKTKSPSSAGEGSRPSIDRPAPRRAPRRISKAP